MSAFFLFYDEKIITMTSLLVGILVNMATAQQKSFPTIGKIHRLDPALDHLIDTTSKIEILGTGYTWSEGPVWVKKEVIYSSLTCPKM